MTEPKGTNQTTPNVMPDEQNEISEKELDKVVGGFDIEQTLNIGSQSGGAGAGK